MTIFNTFSSLKRYSSYPETDILIWVTALVKYKVFGYRTKLYCRVNDLPFLKKYHLYELYDEIDTEFFEKFENPEGIDDSAFWSTRKIEAMYHELFDLGSTDIIYTDVDVFMNKPFNISDCDVLVWSPEPRVIIQDKCGIIDWSKTIYPPWQYLSIPPDYQMPEYIAKTQDAYNCGVWYFKNKEVYAEYRKEYYAFTKNNPCTVISSKSVKFNSALFPCNAEQRILKAVLTKYNQKVNYIMPEKKKGISADGYHFFWYRVAWRLMNKHEVTEEAYIILNTIIYECIGTLKCLNKDIYEFYAKLPWLKNFEERYQKAKIKKIITKYN